MPKGTLQFPLFVLKMRDTNKVVFSNEETDRPLLPLFYSAEDAEAFLKRHGLRCVPSQPLSPKLLYELLVAPNDFKENQEFAVLLDPIETEIEHARTLQKQKLIDRLLRLRDEGR